MESDRSQLSWWMLPFGNVSGTGTRFDAQSTVNTVDLSPNLQLLTWLTCGICSQHLAPSPWTSTNGPAVFAHLLEALRCREHKKRDKKMHGDPQWPTVTHGDPWWPMVTHGDKGVETFWMGQVIGKVMGHPKKGRPSLENSIHPKQNPGLVLYHIVPIIFVSFWGLALGYFCWERII